MFKCNLYSTDVGFFSCDSDKIGEVLVEKTKDGYVEAISKNKINCFVKADKENLYFPQPKDARLISEDVDKYGFSLYIRDNEEERDQENISRVFSFYQKNPDDYIYNRKCIEMEEMKVVEKAKILLKEKIHIDTNTENNEVK